MLGSTGGFRTCQAFILLRLESVQVEVEASGSFTLFVASASPTPPPPITDHHAFSHLMPPVSLCLKTKLEHADAQSNGIL